MIIEIDQSGKVEETGKNTSIAFVNGVKCSIFISGKEKRKLQRFFRSIGKRRMLIYHTFVILIFLLVRDHVRKIDRIVIDTEYPGQNELLRRLLWEKIHAIHHDFEVSQITFKRVGKSSPAHLLAWDVHTRKQPASLKVTAKDVQRGLS